MTVVASILAASACSTTSASEPAVRDLLSRNCVACHDATTTKSELDLTKLTWSLSDSRNRQRWVRIHDRIENGEMPPVSADVGFAVREWLDGEQANKVLPKSKLGVPIHHIENQWEALVQFLKVGRVDNKRSIETLRPDIWAKSHLKAIREYRQLQRRTRADRKQRRHESRRGTASK